MSSGQKIFIVENPNEQRIDTLLTKQYQDYSRTYFQELIEAGHVLLNDQPLKKRHIPSCGDKVKVFFHKRPGPDLTPQPIPLNIIYEDNHLIVVNKPSDMVVHPAPGNWSHTFVNALLSHCTLPETSELRPGIVHRLDKETSGVLIAAKTEIAHQKLVELFQKREIQKEYIAIALGKVPSCTLSEPIHRCPKNRKKMAIAPSNEGKEAITEIKCLAFNGTFSKVSLKPKTGRTHQLRVHLNHIGHPILGDKVYGNISINDRYSIDRHYLHAVKIAFVHPMTQKFVTFEAPLPKEMESIFICGF
ncbi:MAG: Ribosomal large subunit pseudouridine synthase D [Chlamydiae bacterium]|nr:Ribosomal large subunit pseudouridine synthase D [Chlamydiota bacterium]